MNLKPIRLIAVASLSTLSVTFLPGIPSTAARPASHSQHLSRSEMESAVVEFINRYRSTLGLLPLAIRPELTQVARNQSLTMIRLGALQHTDAQGRQIGERLRDAGCTDFSEAGENVAMNAGYADPVETAVDSWLTSEGHRHNIANPRYTETGVGIVERKGRFFFTQVFVCPQTDAQESGN